MSYSLRSFRLNYLFAYDNRAEILAVAHISEETLPLVTILLSHSKLIFSIGSMSSKQMSTKRVAKSVYVSYRE